MTDRSNGRPVGSPERAPRSPAAALDIPWERWTAHPMFPVLCLAFALGLGLFLRLYHLLDDDFPLNDGGLFYSMVRDLQASHYLLPEHTSYNDLSIPFAYPPVPFYLAGLLDAATPLSLVDVLRFLPLAANVLTIVAVYFLARCFLKARGAPELTAIIFAVLPRSYRWLIMGGGLTRSLAFLFAVIAVHQAFLLFERREKKYLATATIFSALTVLSHPEIAWYLGFSLGVLLLCYGRRREALQHSALLLAGVGLLTAPWWGTVLIRSGPAPFLSAAQTGDHTWYVWLGFLSWNFTELAPPNWPAVLAILGAVIVIAEGELFLPVWMVISIVLEPRSGSTYMMVPISMLAALAIVRFVFPLARMPLPAVAGGATLAEPMAPPRPFALARERAGFVLPRVFPLAAVGLFAFYLGFLAVREAVQPDAVLVSITHEDRSGFAWVRDHTPADSRFLVFSNVNSAFVDRVSEWFPTLTGRQSVVTLQGYEWLGVDRFYDQWDQYDVIHSCRDAYCIEAWGRRLGFTHVYLAADCCRALESSLRLSPRYALVYDARGATVFVRENSI